MNQIRLTAEFLAGGTGLGQDIRRIQFAIDLVHPENPMANSVLNVRFHREETDDFGTVGLLMHHRFTRGVVFQDPHRGLRNFKFRHKNLKPLDLRCRVRQRPNFTLRRRHGVRALNARFPHHRPTIEHDNHAGSRAGRVRTTTMITVHIDQKLISLIIGLRQRR